MGTATSRSALLGLVVAILATTGCGGSGRPAVPPRDKAKKASDLRTARLPAAQGTDAWLRPLAAPLSWRRVMIPTGAVLPYPPGWKLEPGDAGTATAVLREGDHRLVGYLNLTPQQGDESLNNWASFRVAHNIGEGDRGVRRISSSHDLRFRNGRGSCVRDEYSTAVGARYVELACLVAGRRGTSVIVGAAPPEVWSRVSMSIERAISAFTT